jgi:hypothetical protein
MATAVAKKQNTDIALADDLLAQFESEASSGLENLTQEDLALPFLKILSGLDSILDEREDARKGDIYNTVTGAVYKGKEGTRVVPCAYLKRYIRWAPRGSGSGAPLNIYTDRDPRPQTQRNSDDNKDYVVGGDGDYIEETHQHFVLVLSDNGSVEPALIAMKSTQLKKSRKWNSMVMAATMTGPNGNVFTPPRFAFEYSLRTSSEENSKGSWHGWEIQRIGPVSSKEVFTRAKDFHHSIMEGDVVVRHENERADSVAPDDDIPF